VLGRRVRRLGGKGSRWGHACWVWVLVVRVEVRVMTTEGGVFGEGLEVNM
jgi:hypothetical protein